MSEARLCEFVVRYRRTVTEVAGRELSAVGEYYGHAVILVRGHEIKTAVQKSEDMGTTFELIGAAIFEITDRFGVDPIQL